MFGTLGWVEAGITGKSLTGIVRGVCGMLNVGPDAWKARGLVGRIATASASNTGSPPVLACG